MSATTELESAIGNPQNRPQEGDVVFEEYNYCKSYLDNFNFKNNVEDALTTTKVLGSVGDIIFPKSYQNLVEFITFGKNIIKNLTNSNKLLLEVSEIMSNIRISAISNQWEEVEKLVKKQIMNNKMEKYKDELDLLSAEAKNGKWSYV